MADSVLFLIHQAVRFYPRHHVAQFGADDFDGVFGVLATAGSHGRRAHFVFGDEALGVFAVLDVDEAFLHRVAAFLVDNRRAGDIFTKFSVIGNGVGHVEWSLTHWAGASLLLRSWQ